jgi:hypothetical protein
MGHHREGATVNKLSDWLGFYFFSSAIKAGYLLKQAYYIAGFWF